jgi:hypothetical protein
MPPKMQDKHLYEYAVIRVVPQVEREEFLNIGVVLYCSRPKFLEALFVLEETRLCIFLHKPDIPQLEEYLLAFQRICKGDPAGGPISLLPPAERFRWLTAARSTVLQTSRVHPGFCADPGETLRKLYHQLVL